MDASQPGTGTALQLRVGAFVLASLLVFAGLVYMLGRSAGLFERQYRLVAGFNQIGGLIQGATVRLAGVPVGRVGAIELPLAGGAKVRVELLIARRVQDRIRADSLARIETIGLLGDKIIDVSLGSPGAAILQEGADLRTEEPFDTGRLTQQGSELVRNLVELSTELRGTLARIAASPAGADIAETVRALRSLATEIERGQGALHRLVYERKLGTALSDAGETLADLRQAMADLRAITGRIEGGGGTLGGLLQDPTVYENLAAFLEGAQRSLLLRALIRSAIGTGAGAGKGANP